MPIRNLFKLDTIEKKIAIPGVLFIAALFVLLAIVTVRINYALMRAQMKNRGAAMANYMAASSALHYAHHDLGALEGLVKEAMTNPDVAYAVFSDEHGNPLTVSSKEPADPSSLLVFEQEIKDQAGTTLGRLSIGYSVDGLRAGVWKGLTIMLVTMTVALAALAAGVAIFVRTVITRPLAKAIAVANKLSEGDLTTTIEIEREDEIGRLLSTMQKMMEKLKSILVNVTDATTDVHSSAHSISAATAQQATVASEQSAAVAEITATMEELSASSTQIAEHSKSVVDLATKAWDSTKKGAEAAETVMMKMHEIHADSQNSINEIVELGRKSREISKVMEIINTIADQTKLIAFNAALEASSAGEAGKRFGVVAVEIRRLADSVMESTGEIEARINEIQDAINRLVMASEKGSRGIQEGIDHTSQTAASLVDIVDAAQATKEAAKQISLSTQQQKTASAQVVSALREITTGAGQTSDAISQISGISKNLSLLSDTLNDLVAVFRLGEDPARPAGRAAHPVIN
ncbi:MAG: HAMP domain-containing methyl-accepting chemotaxis protein [Desulfobacteraceae bacterium]|nr:HAMP domain-containing methyl-accepting chemotaxis protein [Desulfobacteraceae bacterium]